MNFFNHADSTSTSGATATGTEYPRRYSEHPKCFTTTSATVAIPPNFGNFNLEGKFDLAESPYTTSFDIIKGGMDASRRSMIEQMQFTQQILTHHMTSK